MLLFFFVWFWFVFYLLCMEVFKFGGFSFFEGVYGALLANFSHQGFQSSVFFKFVVFFLSVFWGFGLLFPLFSPWACIGFLFFFTNFVWFMGRLFTLACCGFFIFFEGDHSWSWLTSLVMFFSHFLSFLMSGVALTLRISIIFLIGHFLVFTVIDLGLVYSFFFLLILIPVEMFFAFLQSYIFLTLVCMFLLNMI